MASDAIVSAASLTAPLIFFAGCWGLLPGDAIESAAYSLLEGWFASGRVKCVITTWELTIGDLGSLESVFADIATGMPATRAVALFNRTPYAKATGTRLCIVGVPHGAEGFDPNYALISHDADVGVPVLIDCDDAPREFLRTLAARVVSQAQTPFNVEDWLLAFRAVTGEGALGDVEGQSIFAKAVARLSTTAYSHWMRMAVPEVAFERAGCPNCATRSAVLSIACASQPFSRRIVVKCPRCGISLDRDPSSPVRGITLADNSIQIAIEPEISNYSVWATAEQFVGSRLVTRELGCGRLSSSELQYTLVDDELVGARWLLITVLSNWRIAVSRLPVSRARRLSLVHT